MVSRSMGNQKVILLVGPVMCLLGWWIVTASGLIDPLYLPRLSEMFLALVKLFSGNFWPHLWATIYRTLASFTLASLLGVTGGLILGANKTLYRMFAVIIDFFRSLPAPTLFPLFLLFFGIGDLSKIAVAAFLSFWIILINTVYGIWQTAPLRRQVGQVFRAKYYQILLYITVPDALPQIFVGLRVALSLSLIMIIVCEMMIGSQLGLGQRIFDSYVSYHIPQLYALILIVGLLGYTLNQLFVLAEKKLIHWAGK